MKENHVRSIVKGASWRILGTIDTIFLSLIFTANVGTALKIGGVELFTKILLYYIHERIWMQLHIGTEEIIVNGVITTKEKHYRSIIKGISWRITGSLDTFWIALFVNSNSQNAMQTAFYITATEVVTKIFLFWLHERLWLKIRWGTSGVPANT